MNTNPQISVLLPVYNAALFLNEAIQSILDQSFSNFELIIINDGSTDVSETIALSFQDERIVYIKNTHNIGLIATLNKGIDSARGKYIARMDADDVCLPQRFEKQWEVMETNPSIDVCGTSITYFNTNGAIRNWHVPVSDQHIKTALLFGPGFSHPTVFFRRSRLKQHNIFYSKDFIHVEDYELWVRLSSLGFQFYNLNEPLLYYRVHEENISKTNKNNQKKLHLKIQQEQFESFLKRPLSDREQLFFEQSDLKLAAAHYLETVLKLVEEMISKNKNTNYFDDVILKKGIESFMFASLDFSGLTPVNLFSIAFKTPSKFTFCLKKYMKTKLVFK